VRNTDDFGKANGDRNGGRRQLEIGSVENRRSPPQPNAEHHPVLIDLVPWGGVGCGDLDPPGPPRSNIHGAQLPSVDVFLASVEGSRIVFLKLGPIQFSYFYPSPFGVEYAPGSPCQRDAVPKPTERVLRNNDESAGIRVCEFIWQGTVWDQVSAQLPRPCHKVEEPVHVQEFGPLCLDSLSRVEQSPEGEYIKIR